MTRHAWVVGDLARLVPVTDERTAWGQMELRFRGFLGDRDLPEELITSVRCIVTSGDAVLACEDKHPATHIWPGGRREPGEPLEQTAVREVWEETGWALDPTTIRRLGFLHFEVLTPVPENHPYPAPDFLQLVLWASGTPGAADWTDKDDGYVARSFLVPRTELAALPLSEAERAFAAAAFAAT